MFIVVSLIERRQEIKNKVLGLNAIISHSLNGLHYCQNFALFLIKSIHREAHIM